MQLNSKLYINICTFYNYNFMLSLSLFPLPSFIIHFPMYCLYLPSTWSNHISLFSYTFPTDPILTTLPYIVISEFFSWLPHLSISASSFPLLCLHYWLQNITSSSIILYNFSFILQLIHLSQKTPLILSHLFVCLCVVHFYLICYLSQ